MQELFLGEKVSLLEVSSFQGRIYLERGSTVYTDSILRYWIRIELHISLLWHALLAVYSPYSIREVSPYVLKVHRLYAVGVVRRSTHDDKTCDVMTTS